MTKQIQVKTIINRSSESSLNNLLEQAGENWETVEADMCKDQHPTVSPDSASPIFSLFLFIAPQRQHKGIMVMVVFSFPCQCTVAS